MILNSRYYYRYTASYLLKDIWRNRKFIDINDAFSNFYIFNTNDFYKELWHLWGKTLFIGITCYNDFFNDALNFIFRYTIPVSSDITSYVMKFLLKCGYDQIYLRTHRHFFNPFLVNISYKAKVICSIHVSVLPAHQSTSGSRIPKLFWSIYRPILESEAADQEGHPLAQSYSVAKPRAALRYEGGSRPSYSSATTLPTSKSCWSFYETRPQ